MRIISGLAVVLMMALPAFGTSFGLPNEITNGTFDDGLNGWETSGGGIWEEGNPGPSAAVHAHWGGPAEMTLEQTWPSPYPPSVQDIDLSFDWKVYDLSDPDSWIEVVLTADGQPVWSWRSDGAPDAWIHEEFIIPGIFVEEFKDIHITLHAEGDDITGAAIDNIDVEQVPEPTALALFGLGLSALVLVRRRR